tara:strand:+ start:4292 stop:5623 length:1332 start_codon:yes stop_codon:yes gene_type:complete
MFYIVEENSKLENLRNLLKLGAFVDVIPGHYSFHPKLTNTTALYVRILKSIHGYIIPIDHSEGLNVDKDRILEILNSCSKLYTLNKKELLYHFPLPNAIDLSLLYSMTYFERLEYSKESSLLNYYYNKFRGKSDINRLVPLSKLYEICENLYNKVSDFINLEIPDGFKFYNNTATSVFYLLEQQGIDIFYEAFVEKFNPRDTQFNINNNTVFTSYNLYNATSRPTNSFNSINFAAIPHTKEHRKCFKPKGDYFVEFDFDGYHLRLLCEQISYKLTNESAHKQLAKLYFGKDNITDEEYTKAKQINFQAIYGKIPEEHKDLEIFKEIQEYIDAMWSMYNDNGVVWNPQSSKPFTKELKDMHPAKLMNYMMQSLETSNNVLILKEILRYLRNKKTKVVLYTYDALLFDFSKEDGKETLQEIQKILEKSNKYPVKFKFSKDLVLEE